MLMAVFNEIISIGKEKIAVMILRKHPVAVLNVMHVHVLLGINNSGKVKTAVKILHIQIVDVKIV